MQSSAGRRVRAPSHPPGRFAQREPGEDGLMKRLLAVLGAVVALAAVIAAVAVAGKGPERIALPDGYRPEGIAAGKGQSVYVGSIPTGRVLEIDTKTGAPGRRRCRRATGHAAIGLKYDKRADRLFVSGGPTGKAFVYDAEQRRRARGVPAHRRRPADLHQRRRADARFAYFTDSRQPVIYAVSRDLSGVTPIALTGFPMTPGRTTSTASRRRRKGRLLLAIQSSDGRLWRIDAATGSHVAGRPRRRPSSRTATGCCWSASARCWWCRTARTRSRW